MKDSKKTRALKRDARLERRYGNPLMRKKMWIEKWDGKLPTTATGDSGVMINLGN